MTISFHDEKAFTLIEIIVVLLMIAIISIIIFSRIWFTNAELIAAGETVKAQLRYAQAQSLNSESTWGIHCDGNAYWLFKDGNLNQRVLLPGEHSYGTPEAGELKATVYLDKKNITSMETFTLSFDDRGIPHTDASASDGQELVSSDPESRITVTAGGESMDITITPNTGFIP